MWALIRTLDFVLGAMGALGHFEQEKRCDSLPEVCRVSEASVPSMEGQQAQGWKQGDQLGGCYNPTGQTVAVS